MPVSITSNFAADISHRNVVKNADQVTRSLSKLSSGQRVFSAEEDAAALAIGTGLRVDISALRAAQINTQQGVAILQIADGSLGRISDIMIRMKSLAAQSISDTVSAVERSYIDTEYQELIAEIERISQDTEFNGLALLGGTTSVLINTVGANVDTDDGFVGFSFLPGAATAGDVFEVDYFAATNVMTITNQTTSVSQTIFVQSPQVGQVTEYTFSQAGVVITLNSDFDDTTNIVHAGATEEFDTVAGAVAAPTTAEFQIGTGTDSSDRITITLPVTNTSSLSIAGTDVASAANASTALDALSTAFDNLNNSRGQLGAAMNRLEFASGNVQLQMENSLAAQSTLLDVDVAEEITRLTSQQILFQSSLEMLREANERPASFLTLLQ